jgi:hypothetical protein
MSGRTWFGALAGVFVVTAIAGVVLCGCEKQGSEAQALDVEGPENTAAYERALTAELSFLEGKIRTLDAKMEGTRAQIRQVQESHGMGRAESQMEMILRRLAMIQDEVTVVEMNRTGMECELAVRERGADANAPADEDVEALRGEVERLRMYEGRLREMVADQEARAADLGRSMRAMGAIEKLEFQMEIDRELYRGLCQAVQEAELELVRVRRAGAEAGTAVE